MKSGGDIPAVGGAFRGTTSVTDAAYEPAPSGEQQGPNVQFIRGSVQSASTRYRTNPTTGAPEVWSDAQNKWVPRATALDSSIDRSSAGG